MGAKILIVEDSEDFAWLIKKFCDHLGHSATVACDGQSAMASIDSDKFDLIVSDLTLPDISGFDLIKLIREKTDVPALTITGRTSTEDVQRALAAGFDAHCSKPIENHSVVSKIQELLGLPPV